MSRPEFCVVPNCPNRPHDQIKVPVCGQHATSIYLDVKPILASATKEHYLAAARSIPPKLGPKGPRRMQEGAVYFFRIGEHIKIGWSANPRQRARQLGADKILLVLPGTPDDEKALHARFGQSWSHREYFHPTQEILDFVAQSRVA